MPGLIKQGCAQVLSRLVTLIELLRRNYFVEECLWYRLSRLVMFGEVLQYLRPNRPHLVNLRWILDKIARHACSAKPRIGHVRKHSMQGMTELMKSSPHFIVRQQRRFAWRR